MELVTEVDTKREHELIKRWIRPDPHKPGPAEARVLPHHVSVWALVELWELDHQKSDVVAEEYELPLEAVEAALDYYRRHKADVVARIERNRASFKP